MRGKHKILIPSRVVFDRHEKERENHNTSATAAPGTRSQAVAASVFLCLFFEESENEVKFSCNSSGDIKNSIYNKRSSG
jgi:hypothetical protein